MARKMLGVFTAVAAALLFVGVAWAATDGTAEVSSSTEATAPTIPDERITAPTAADADTISNTVDIVVDDDDDDTRSSSIDDDDDDTTVTSIHEEDDDDDTRSSSIDDDDDDTTVTSIDDDEDEQDGQVFEDQSVVYNIPNVGSVPVAIVDGRLELGVISAPGWDYEVETTEADQVEVKFRRGSDEVEFEAEIEQGKIKIEIELESS